MSTLDYISDTSSVNYVPPSVSIRNQKALLRVQTSTKPTEYSHIVISPILDSMAIKIIESDTVEYLLLFFVYPSTDTDFF